MLKIDSPFIGMLIVAPVIAGAFLSGIFYVVEGAAIPLTIFQIFLIAAFILFFFRQIIIKETKIQVYGLETYYLLFVGLIFFSLIYSPERGQGLFLALRMIVLLLMTYVIYNLIDEAKVLKLICYVILISAVFVAVQSIIDIYINPEIAAFNYANQGQKLMRIEGVESDPNIFASNLILPIMLIGAHFNYSKNFKGRIFKFIVLGVLLSAVLLTYSRSSWVSIVIGLFFIMWIQKKFSLLFYLVLSFVVIFSMSDTVRTLTFSVFERFLDIFAGESDDSSKFRIILAKTSVLMILDTYMIGVGYQGFSTAFQKYHPPEETLGIYEPHNEFYAVFSELGIIGFVLFLMIIGQILRTMRMTLKLVKEDIEMRWIAEGVAGAFISYIVFFQFLGGMMLHSIFIINVSLVFCAYNIVQNRIENG